MTFLTAANLIIGTLNFVLMGWWISEKSLLWIVNFIAGAVCFYAALLRLM